MKAVKLQSHIGADGLLELQLPRDFHDSDVIVLIRPVPSQKTSENELSWHDFLNKYAGCLADSPIERGDQGDYEIREEIE